MEEGVVLGARCTGPICFDMTALEDRSVFDKRSTVIRCLSDRIESEQLLVGQQGRCRANFQYTASIPKLDFRILSHLL